MARKHVFLCDQCGAEGDVRTTFLGIDDRPRLFVPDRCGFDVEGATHLLPPVGWIDRLVHGDEGGAVTLFCSIACERRYVGSDAD